MKGERDFLLYMPHSEGNFSKVIFRSLSVLEISEGSGNSLSCGMEFVHVGSPSGFTCIFFLYNNVHATCVEVTWVPFVKITFEGLSWE